MAQFLQAALNGPAMTTEELSDVGDATMSQFEGLRCGKATTLAFVQSGEGVAHRLLHRLRILGNHGGDLKEGGRSWPEPRRLPTKPCAKKAKCDS
jgi:hypothetical protein